ncbi:MAG TPA: DUF3006 family protein [Bacilli bacterium]|nr:DUF3006 family protein [Bacilli bacterium]
MEAVLDRIVDKKYAVLLVGEAEEERVVPLSQLPQGAEEGMRYKLTMIEGEMIAIENIDEDVEQSEALKEKLTLLRKRKKSQFKRS